MTSYVSSLQNMTLRHRLRQDTVDAHVALDQAVSGFDLCTVGGLSGFLAMQAGALAHLQSQARAAQTGPLIDSLLQRVRQDQAALGCGPVPPPSAGAPDDIHPVAIDYVIAGSRLGSQVLARRWAAATDARVRRAKAYFAQAADTSAWRGFCRLAEQMPANSAEADLIVIDSRRLFVFYHACASAALQLAQVSDA